jgi:hypothetical protein
VYKTMGRTGSPETSVSSHIMPRNNPEDGRIQFYCGGKLQSRNYYRSDTINTSPTLTVTYYEYSNRRHV